MSSQIRVLKMNTLTKCLISAGTEILLSIVLIIVSLQNNLDNKSSTFAVV